MTKFQKWLMIINIGIFILILVKIFFFRGKEEWTPPPLVDNTEEIEIEKRGIDSINIVINSLETAIANKNQIIDSKNKSLIKLKESYEKKKTNIVLLPADESVKFFTEFIGQEQ